MKNIKINLNTQNSQIKKEPLYSLVGKGIKELWNSKWKSLFIVIYMIIATILWNKSQLLFDMFPFGKLPEFIHNIVEMSYNIIVGITLLLGLLQMIIFIGKTYTANKIKKEFPKIKLPNNAEMQFLYEKKDKQRKYGKIFTFEIVGLTKDDLDNSIATINSGLRKYNIKKISIDNYDNGIAHLYCISKKYDKPKIIDIWFLKNYVNCLLIGATGTR